MHAPQLKKWTAIIDHQCGIRRLACNPDLNLADLSGLDAGRVSTEDGARALKLEESRLARAASKAANVEKIV